MKDIEMIIGSEELERNRRRHLAAEARRRKQENAETVFAIVGSVIIAFMFATVLLGWFYGI
jgi:hypothetical protein